MPISKGRSEDLKILVAGFFLLLILIGIGIGWVLPVDQKDVTLSFASMSQNTLCNQFNSTTALNETGVFFNLMSKSANIIFWLTVTLTDNLTSTGVSAAIFWNTTVLANNIACGNPTTGANQISLGLYVSPSVASTQNTYTYSFEWTLATPNTLYTFFLATASSVAHAKIAVVAKLGQAIKTNMIGQAI